MELKPCPFCGNEVKEWDNSNALTVNVIECTHCKVRFVFPCSIISDIIGDDYIQTFNKRGQLAKWVERGGIRSPYCSFCGAIGDGANYCSHCGAEMVKDGKQDEIRAK